MSFEPDSLNFSEAVKKAQRKDLFEPEDEHDFIPISRELDIQLTIHVMVNVTEPPFVSDDVIRASLESYLVKAIASQKYLQMSTIEVHAHTDNT